MDSAKAEGQQRPEIDGLRALAIVPVVLFHAGLGCPGGFIGVDVFFVISGFLIGGIILRELEAGSFSFGNFWTRRARRIVPALFFFFAAMFLAGWWIMSEHDFVGLASQMAWGLAGLANFKMLALTGGYWAANANSLALLHVWSLAVEEQFYVFLPVVLVVAHRWKRRQTGAVIAGLFGASFCVSLYWSAQGYPANFYLLPSRAWELLAGCVGAWALQNGLALRRRGREVVTAAGVAAIVATALIARNDMRWPDARALLPTLGALAVLISPPGEEGPTWAGRLLSLAAVRFVGLISYSFYLWHWPALFYLREYGPENVSTAERWGAVTVALALAILSWRCVELPFRNKLPKWRVARRPLLIGAGAAWVCLMAAATGVVRLHSATRVEAALPAMFKGPGRESISDYDARERIMEGGFIINADGGAPRCVVLGSSHGMMLGPVVQTLSGEYHAPCAFFTESATSPLFVPEELEAKTPRKIREMRQRDDAVRGFITKWKPDLVIVAAKWNNELAAWGQGLGPKPPSFAESASNTLRWLGEHARAVAVVGQVPELPFGYNEDVGRTVWRRWRDRGGVSPKLMEKEDAAAGRAEALKILQRSATTNVFVIDPTPLLENADGSLKYNGTNGLFYFDYNHLNSLGSEELKPLLEPFFRAMTAPARR